MSLSFPTSPSVGQTYQGWKWNGSAWDPNYSNNFVTSFNGRTGAVTLNSADIGAANARVKNYIINGAMQISQDTLGAAVTAAGTYPVDQFELSYTLTGGAVSLQQVALATPSGSPNRLRMSVTTAQASLGTSNFLAIVHPLEGERVSDIRYGSAAAKTLTVQFGVRAPAGTYGVTFRNGAANRSYTTDFTVAAGEAGTDVVKSVTIPGDVTGTWATDNTMGIQLIFPIVSGATYQQVTNSWQASAPIGPTTLTNTFLQSTANTFDLFDVGMYQGIVAPPFQVPDYAAELAVCMRYFEQGTEPLMYLGGGLTGTVGYGSMQFVVPKRIGPTCTPSGWQYWSATSSVAIAPTLAANLTLMTWSPTGLTNFNGWNSTGTWKASARF